MRLNLNEVLACWPRFSNDSRVFARLSAMRGELAKNLYNYRIRVHGRDRNGTLAGASSSMGLLCTKSLRSLLYILSPVGCKTRFKGKDGKQICKIVTAAPVYMREDSGNVDSMLIETRFHYEGE